jgi:hypothetical protein
MKTPELAEATKLSSSCLFKNPCNHLINILTAFFAIVSCLMRSRFSVGHRFGLPAANVTAVQVPSRIYLNYREHEAIPDRL